MLDGEIFEGLMNQYRQEVKTDDWLFEQIRMLASAPEPMEPRVPVSAIIGTTGGLGVVFDDGSVTIWDWGNEGEREWVELSPLPGTKAAARAQAEAEEGGEA